LGTYNYLQNDNFPFCFGEGRFSMYKFGKYRMGTHAKMTWAFENGKILYKLENTDEIRVDL
jgi:hypothetical protein